MAAHAKLSPSAAKRWGNCPGSVALCATLPKVRRTSKYAAEGTLAHELAEALVTGAVDAMALQARVGTVAKVEGFDIEVIQEMVDGAIEYRDAIEEAKARLTGHADIHAKAEVKACASSVDPDLWGTADHALFQKGNLLFIHDYKFGRGVVEAEENEQLLTYAVGVMDTLAGWVFNKVVLCIVQPRAGHEDGTVRYWEVTPQFVADWRDSWLKPAVAATREPGAKLCAGDWCRFCDAKPVCPTVHQAVQAQAQVDFEMVVPATPKGLPEARLLTVEQLGKALSWKEAVESWFVAVKEAVQEKLAAGTEVPGWKLVEGRSNRQWVDEEAAVSKFTPLIGSAEACYEPRKVLSPSKMEKKLGGKKGKELVAPLAYKPPAEPSVAPESDPRERLRMAPAAADFEAVKTDLVVFGSAAMTEDGEHVPLAEVDLMAELSGGAKSKVPQWPV